MKISVCMTVHSKSPYLIEQLDSIFNQGYRIDQLVIIEDKSNVSMKNEILEKIPSYLEYSYHENEETLGPFLSFKKGIELCEGDLIFFSDQDDIWMKNKVEKVIDFMSSNHGIDIVIHNAKIIGSDNNFRDGDLYHDVWRVERNWISNIAVNKSIGACMVVRKDFAKKNLNAIKIIPHDWILSTIALKNKKLSTLSDPLIYYRRHESTFTGRKKLIINLKANLNRFYHRISLLLICIFWNQ